MQATSAILSVPRKNGKTSSSDFQSEPNGLKVRSTAPPRPVVASAQPERIDRTDLQLLEAFQTGEERAFAELYTRYKSEIYTFCLRMLGGDSQEAGDAFQETFIKVYEKAATFTYGENIRGWLYMSCRQAVASSAAATRSERVR